MKVIIRKDSEWPSIVYHKARDLEQTKFRKAIPFVAMLMTLICITCNCRYDLVSDAMNDASSLFWSGSGVKGNGCRDPGTCLIVTGIKPPKSNRR